VDLRGLLLREGREIGRQEKVRGEEREGKEQRGEGKEERSPSQIGKVKRWQP